MENDVKGLPLCVYVDVDDTLVRSVGAKRIPMPGVIAHVRGLFLRGAVMYCWSAGGAAYAREVAEAVGLGECFVGYLPKPQVMIDDREVGEWPGLVVVHPTGCGSRSIEGYWEGRGG